MAAFLELILSDSFKNLSELYISAAKTSAMEKEKGKLKDSLLSFLLLPEHQKGTEGARTMIPVEGEYERGPIIAELVHEALCHAAVRGLNQTDSILLVQSLLEGLQWIKNKDTFGELDEEIKSLLESLTTIFTTQHGRQVSTQYLLQTLLLHPHLYHYLMNEEQERDVSHSGLQLYPPSQPLPLTDGMPEEEWYRKERLTCVDAQYELQKNQLITEQDESLEEERGRLEKLYDDLNESFEDEERVGQEELKTVIGPLVMSHVAGTKTELLHKLKEQETNISHKMDRIKAWRGEKRTSPEK